MLKRLAEMFGWAWRPVSRMAQRRVETSKPVVELDHGLKVSVFTDPVEIEALPPAHRLDLRPDYLVGQEFYLSKGPAPVGPDLQTSMWRWARDHGANDVYATHVLVLIQATADRSIALRQPRVHHEVESALDGLICMPEGLGGGGNGLLVRRFYVDLDAPAPRAEYVADDGSEPGLAVFELEGGETAAFLVIAESTRGLHRWSVTIPTTVDGAEVSLEINDDGDPFVTVGPQDIRAIAWVEDEQRWIGMGD